MNSNSTPFCCFCKALGKHPSVYTSHWVKDKIGGSVVCPALLANECGYCHGKGHTPKFCPKLKARDARRALNQSQRSRRAVSGRRPSPRATALAEAPVTMAMLESFEAALVARVLEQLTQAPTRKSPPAAPVAPPPVAPAPAAAEPPVAPLIDLSVPTPQWSPSPRFTWAAAAQEARDARAANGGQ